MQHAGQKPKLPTQRKSWNRAIAPLKQILRATKRQERAEYLWKKAVDDANKIALESPSDESPDE